jgi:ubiquinone/menaquinone biosynthesis C-methylase UbiE
MDHVRISADLQNHYANYYATGDSEWRRLGALDKAANIVALCRDLPHDSVLEIGAGEGSVLTRLSELSFGRELYALEISPTGLETIRNRRIPGLVECAPFDGYGIPYGEARFDLAVLSHVVEHVEHPRRLLCEAGRVARQVFVEVPLEDTARLPPDFTFDSTGHINFYSPKTIRRLVQTCGLEVLRQKTTTPSKAVHRFKKGARGVVDYHVKKGLLALAPRLAPHLFTYHSALVCRTRAFSTRLYGMNGLV